MKTRPGFRYDEDTHQWVPLEPQGAEESSAVETSPEPAPAPAPTEE
ncbi:MAG: hypothetical protein MUF16_04975 [Burkholderiaceae bacterium]|nr:hypothetical protein [Burkholderiaceae bacterium]